MKYILMCELSHGLILFVSDVRSSIEIHYSEALIWLGRINNTLYLSECLPLNLAFYHFLFWLDFLPPWSIRTNTVPSWLYPNIFNFSLMLANHSFLWAFGVFCCFCSNLFMLWVIFHIFQISWLTVLSISCESFAKTLDFLS